MVEPVALGALALDAAIGWPAWLYARIGHPVGAFARLIDACEARWNDHRRSDRRRRMLGVLTVLLLV
ncbi:MAG: cobalamin biosynthesis protein, partial [Sphingobium sp.]